MSTNWPPSNLPDEAQKWRRKIEDALDSAQRDGSIAKTNGKAVLKGQSSLRRAVNRAGLEINDALEQVAQAARVPAAPANPDVTTDAYFDEYGYPRASAFATVDEVTEDVNGEPIGITRYELAGRPNIAGQSWAIVAEQPAVFGEAPQLQAMGLPAGEEWALKVRAISEAGVAGEYSAEIIVTLAKDETAPPKPAALTGTSRLGQVILDWTGKTATGDEQPADFSHGEVFMATTAAGAGAAIGRIGRADTLVAPEQPYNEDRWYYVEAVDFAGNRSVPSDRISVATKALVDTDVIGRVLDGANIKLDSINEELIAAGAITEEKISDQVNEKIDGAASDAGEALGIADQALQEALAAALEAGDALRTADGKNRIYVQRDSPGDNLVTNGSFEETSGTVELARNYATNPLFVGNAGWTLDTYATVIGDGQLAINDSAPSGALLGYETFSRAAAPGEVWTVSRDFSVPVGYPAVRIRLAAGPYAGGAAVSGEFHYSPITTIQPGETVRLSATTAALGPTITGMRSLGYLQETPGTIGRRLYMGKALLEKATIAGDFFDGSTPPKVARNLCQSPIPVAGSSWTPGASVVTMTDGTPCLEVTASGLSTPYIFSATSAEPAVSGEVYTMKAKFEVVGDVPGASYIFRLHSRSGNGYFASGAQQVVATGGVQEVTVVGTLNADVLANSLDLSMVRVGAGGAGVKLRMGRVMIVKGEYTGEHFDPTDAPAGFGSAWEGATDASPSYLYDADLSVAWLGAANASEAILTGAGLASVSGAIYTGGRGFQSSRWAKSGPKSLRITPWGTGGSSNAAVAMSAPIPAGKTHTITATAYLEAPLTGTNESYARRLRAGSPSKGFTVSPQIPNEAGEHEVRWVLTPEADITTFQLWHGGMPGSPDIWWDSLVVLEGDVDKPYTQGDQWWQLNDAGTSIVGVKVWDGARWNPYTIVAEDVIAVNSITGALIKANAITAEKILAGAVVADKIGTNAVTADKIEANAVTTVKLAALSVEAGKIAANAVVADKINAGAVTTVKLDALAVTAEKIAANAVTADKIEANAITAKHTITGALIRTAASGARTEMNSSGLRVLNASNQELVRLGYGIATGMEVRNPATGTLVPLASAAFGLVSVERSNVLAYAPTGAPAGQFTPVTRHTADDCILTFTAVSSSYIVNFSQVWAISSYTSGGVMATPYVGLTVNGASVLAAGNRLTANPASGLSGIFPNSFQRIRQFSGGARITTTPGVSYTLMMDFQMEVSKNPSGPVSLSLNERYITATPVFQ